jgi:hypothetical protein
MLKIATRGLCLLLFCVIANAGVIDVTYQLTGSAGSWDLNFTVANNLTGTSQDIYEFGVALTNGSITGSPAGYDPTFPAFTGVGPTFYNNAWLDSFFLLTLLPPGTNLSGFSAHTDTMPVGTVQWFAYTIDPNGLEIYSGPGAFASNFDGFGSAGFEGVATEASAAVPEPSIVTLTAIGLALAVFGRRKLARG